MELINNRPPNQLEGESSWLKEMLRFVMSTNQISSRVIYYLQTNMFVPFLYL